MSKRNLFGNGNVFGEEQDSDRKEYNPPEEKLVDAELVDKLMENYMIERKRTCWWIYFTSNVENLESVIKDVGDRFDPQFLIDVLPVKLKHEYPRLSLHLLMLYLTEVIQALYNLDYNNLTIDISDWPENHYRVGDYLRGRPDRPLTLNLYGNFQYCGRYAKYCNFNLYDAVEWCGWYAKYCDFNVYNEVKESFGTGAQHSNFIMHDVARAGGAYAEHCNFTFYDTVFLCCGTFAKNCTFSLLPNAEIDHYVAKESEGNVLRRLNKKGEWETIG